MIIIIIIIIIIIGFIHHFFSIKSVYITVPHESHYTILCVLASKVHVALRRIPAQYHIQISDENTSIHSYTDRVTNIS